MLAPVLPILYRVLQPAFSDCLWAGDATTPTIALTFDDGPHPQYTLPLLDVLDRHQVKATFFWLGVCVDRHPTIARAVWERGHQIGLHGYDHRAFPTLSVAELKQSLEKTRTSIAQACQLDPNAIEQICDVRPPNGLFTPSTLFHLRQWSYRPVMWSVVPEDWVLPGVEVVVQRVLEQTRNGSHIVLHDGQFGGRDVATIAQQLIPQLLDRGYQFVTIDQWQI